MSPQRPNPRPQLLTLLPASSMIAAGLSWRMAIGACVLGNTIMGLVITFNGRIGATVHPARCSDSPVPH